MRIEVDTPQPKGFLGVSENVLIEMDVYGSTVPTNLYSTGMSSTVDNLLPADSVETSVSNFGADSGSPILSMDTTRSWSGRFSLKAAAQTNSNDISIAAFSNQMYFVAGQTYTFSWYEYNVGSPRKIYVDVTIGPGANYTYVSGPIDIFYGVTTGSWQRFAITFTATTTSTGTIYLHSLTNNLANNAFGDTRWLDGFKLEVGTTATTFVPRKYSNLATNADNLSNGVRWWGSGGNGTTTQYTTGGPTGAYTRKLWTVGAPDDDTGYTVYAPDAGAGIDQVVTASIWMRSNRPVKILAFLAGYSDGTSNFAIQTTSAALTTQWQRIIFTITPDTGKSIRTVVFGPYSSATGDGVNNWVAGDWLDAADAQIEMGYQANPYIDGTLTHTAWDASNNLITNSSFETDTSGWTGLSENLMTADDASMEGSMGNWSHEVSQTSFLWSTAKALVGTHSLSMTATTNGYIWARCGSYNDAYMQAAPGALLTGVASLIADTTPRNFYLQFTFWDANKNYVTDFVGSTYSDSTAGWTQARVIGFMPSNATYVSLAVRYSTAVVGETHYLDCAGIYETPVITGNGVNLIDNADFEVDTYGWGPSGAGDVVSRTTTDSYTGTSCLQMTNTSGFSQARNSTLSGHLNTFQQYTMSAWVKGTGTARIYLSDFGGNNIGYTNVITLTGAWQRITSTGVPQVAGMVFVVENDGGGATFLIDAVKVEMGSTATAFVPRTYTNLLTNPGYATDMSGWFQSYSDNPATITRITNDGPISNTSVDISIGAVTNIWLVWDGPPITNLEPGKTYTLSWYARQVSGIAINPNMQIANPGGIHGAIPSGESTLFSPTGSWQRYTHTFTCDSNYQSDANVYLSMSVGVAFALRVANFQLELGHQANPYVDGTLGVGYSWDSSNNLITNPSFETDTSGWTGLGENLLADASMEAGLSIWGNSFNCTVAQTTATALDGTHSLQLTATATGGMSANTDQLRSTSQFAVPGRLYTAIAYVRAATTPRQVQLQMRFVNAAGNAVTTSVYSSVYADNNGGWTQVRVVGVADTLAASVDFIITFLDSAVGEVHYVDCVGIYETPLISGGGVNTINNGDFEIDTTNWSLYAATGSPTLTRSNARSYTGVGSMLVTLGAQAGGFGSCAYIPSMPLTTGVTYTFSAWVYIPAANWTSPSVVLRCDQGGGWTTSANCTTTDQWVRLSATFTASSDASNVNIIANGINSDGAQFYVDAVKLEVGGTATDFVPRSYTNLWDRNSGMQTGANWSGFVEGGSNGTVWAGTGVLPAMQIVADGHVLPNSIKLFGPTSGTSGSLELAGGFGVSQNPEYMAPGQVVTHSVWVKAPAGKTLNFSIGYLDASSNGLSSSFPGTFTATGDWQRMITTGQVPAAAYFVQARVMMSNPGSTDTFQIQAWQMELGYQANPYVDGSLGIGYSWDSSNNLLPAVSATFEGGTTGGWGTGWSTNGLTNTTTQAYEGSHSLMATKGASDGDNTHVFSLGLPTLAPHTTYTFSAWIRTSVSSYWVFGDDGSFSTITASAGQTIPANGWTRVFWTFTTGTDVSGLVVLRAGADSSFTPLATGTNAYIDAVQLEQRCYPTSYGNTGTAALATSTVNVPWGLVSQEDGFVVRSAAAGGGSGSWQANVGVNGTVNNMPLNPNLWASGASYKTAYLPPNTTYTLTAYTQGAPLYAMVDGPAITLPIYVNANSSGSLMRTGGITFTTNSTGGVAYIRYYTLGTSNIFYLDAVQLEQRAYATPWAATGAVDTSSSTVTIPWGLASQTPIFRGGPGGADVGSYYAWTANGVYPQWNPNLYGVGVSYKATLAASTVYTFSIYTNVWANQTLMVDGPALSAPVYAISYSDGGTWIRKSVTFVTNSLGGTAYLRTYMPPNSAAAQYDAAQLEQRSFATPFQNTGVVNTTTSTVNNPQWVLSGPQGEIQVNGPITLNYQTS